jgi:adenylosuccinate lyase
MNNYSLEIYSLLSISPIDGRYAKRTNELNMFFSEFALIKYRTYIECQYLIALEKEGLIKINSVSKYILNTLMTEFSIDNAKEIKNIETRTNHDVKAVEYFLRDKLNKEQPEICNFIHFALTSQDINSSANILSIKESVNSVMIPTIFDITKQIQNLVLEWQNITFLSMTHGQPASPSKLGKEFQVFLNRLDIQINELNKINYTTKFGGAVGNFNAHISAYPKIDWIKFANNFIETIGLNRNIYTTQIDHYDNYSIIFDIFKRINVILIDLCQDIWLYISRNIIKQKIVKGEVGSSTMPHKVNPIDFENAEGNLYMANSLFEVFSRKLPVSRMQRDLTDSTILRNIGSAFGYSLIAYKSIIRGINKLDTNTDIISKELYANYVIIAEGIQTKLKVFGIENSYEKIKDITRNNLDTETLKQNITEFINDLDLTTEQKQELMQITPENYFGICLEVV